MPIAHFFARTALSLTLACALVTGTAQVLGKIAPDNAGIIYFVTQSEQYILDPTRLIRYNLTLQQGINSTLFPSPDGQQIAYRQGIVDHSEIKIFDFGTGETSIIYSHPLVGTFPFGSLQIFSWSPSGRYLSFRSNERLLKYDFLTGGMLPMINEARGNFLNDANPSWSPDETRIAFVSASRQTNYWQVYLVNDDGSDLRSISRADVCAFFRPHWSPVSNNLIVFDAACDNIPTVFLLDVAAQRFTPLSDLTVPTSSPLWSPDGSKILFVEGAEPQTRRVYLFDLARSQAQYLVDGNTALWSPDGSKILFSGSDGDLYTIQPDSSELQRLTFHSGNQIIYPQAWSW